MIKVGIIGFGRMGRFYLKEMLKSPKWEVVYICDVYEGSRELARKLAPNAKVISDEDIIFNDPEIQVVTVYSLLPMLGRRLFRGIREVKTPP